MASLLLLACVSCAGDDTTSTDTGVEHCYGGTGIVVQVTRTMCAGTFDSLRVTLSSNGAEHEYDLIAADAVSEPWPDDFARGDGARVDVLLYGGGPCSLRGSADALVDPEVCAPVPVTTTCHCLAP